MSPLSRKRQQMLELPAGVVPPQGSPVSEHTQQRIDDAIRSIVMAGFTRAPVCCCSTAMLDRGARALLEKETLDEAAIRELAPELSW